MYNDTEIDFYLGPNTTLLSTSVDNITTTQASVVVLLQSTASAAPHIINYTVVSNETGEIITIQERVGKVKEKLTVSDET